MIPISKYSPSIFFKAFICFLLNPGSIHEGTPYCPGKSCWQNQTDLNAELLGTRRIGKCDHPIGRQPMEMIDSWKLVQEPQIVLGYKISQEKDIFPHPAILWIPLGRKKKTDYLLLKYS